MSNIINHILVIDDQKVVRHTLFLCLKNIGYESVFQAENGLAARACLENQAIDLIFCDLNMPVEDGFAVLKFLASIQFAGAIVLISNEGSELLDSCVHLAKQYKLRILGCIPKPIEVGRLKALLQEANHQASHNAQGKVIELSPADILKAITDDRLVVYFQPQVNLATSELKGLEVLTRITSEQGQLLYPDSFIAVAEQSPDLMLMLTKAVIRQALGAIVPFQAQLANITIAFNISGKMLNNETFVQWLLTTIEQYHILPEQIICELTETAINDDPTLLIAQMLRLRMARFKLSIDDFGTGYSSLEQLHTIPFHELKIDKQFVQQGLNNTKSAAVVEQSIRLAKAMGLEVVAEGIETLQHEIYLKGLGCDIGQGYYFAKALPIAEIVAQWSNAERVSNEGKA